VVEVVVVVKVEEGEVEVVGLEVAVEEVEVEVVGLEVAVVAKVVVEVVEVEVVVEAKVHALKNISSLKTKFNGSISIFKQIFTSISSATGCRMHMS